MEMQKYEKGKNLFQKNWKKLSSHRKHLLNYCQNCLKTTSMWPLILHTWEPIMG